ERRLPRSGLNRAEEAVLQVDQREVVLPGKGRRAAPGRLASPRDDVVDLRPVPRRKSTTTNREQGLEVTNPPDPRGEHCSDFVLRFSGAAATGCVGRQGDIALWCERHCNEKPVPRDSA